MKQKKPKITWEFTQKQANKKTSKKVDTSSTHDPISNQHRELNLADQIFLSNIIDDLNLLIRDPSPTQRTQKLLGLMKELSFPLCLTEVNSYKKDKQTISNKLYSIINSSLIDPNQKRKLNHLYNEIYFHFILKELLE